METYLKYFDEWFNTPNERLGEVPLSVTRFYNSPEFEDSEPDIVACVSNFEGCSLSLARKIVRDYNQYLHDYVL